MINPLYKILHEAAMTQVAPGTTTPAGNVPKKPVSTTFNTVFKPMNIAGFTMKPRNVIMTESSMKLQSINLFANELKKRAANPANRNAELDKLKFKYCELAYKIHHEFITKAIFWKSRVKFNMGPQFSQLKEQYTRSLFTLQQEFKREELGLSVADTSNY